jgi:hypothetical protein
MTKHMIECFLCQRPFQFGAHVYNGRKIPQWGEVMICDTCERGNRDGLVPSAHRRLLEHLREQGITPSYNKKGLIVIPAMGAT